MNPELLEAILALSRSGGDDALIEATALLRAHQSHDERRRKVQKAITTRARANFDGEPYMAPYVYVRDFFDGQVVYESGEKLFQCSWDIDGDDVKLGSPKRVSVAYAPMTEADPTLNIESNGQMDEFTPLIEASRDGTIPIKLIAPGQGSSGYYSAEVLKRDGPRVFRAGLKMFIDHPTKVEEQARPEGSIANLGGILVEDAAWRDDAKHGPGLYARAKTVGRFKDALPDLAPHIGVSIRAFGNAKVGKVDGRDTRVIESITSAKSVDFVTAAGAGGKVLDLFESLRTPLHESGLTPGQEDTMSDTQLAALQEAVATLTSTVTAMAGQLQTATANQARLTEGMALREARDFVAAELARPIHSRILPAVTRDRLMGELVREAPVTEGALNTEAFKATVTEAIKRAKGEIADILGPHGHVVDLGESDATDRTPAQTLATLEEALVGFGLSKDQAAIAATGR